MTKLDQLLQCIKKTKVYVQMHNYPDQDALASAFGLKTLLAARNKEAVICYYGIIDKSNTLKMIEELNIKIHVIDELNFQPDDEIILVDSQKGNVNVKSIIGSPIACIDHHILQTVGTYLFSDIRSEVGSCSSIIASYFFDNHVVIPRSVATALVYGQKMDTAQLSRGVSELDIDMFYRLYKLADNGLLRTFDTSSLKLTDLNAYQKAISNLRIYGNIGIANIGKNCSEAIIGSVSDFLLTISGIDFTLIYSFRAGGIKFSVRSSLEYIDASYIIRKALKGYGDGGGHSDMAAGFIPDICDDDAFHVSNKMEQKIIKLVHETQQQAYLI